MSRFTATVPTLVDLLRGRAGEGTERLAYTFLQEDGSEISLTYQELDRKARALAVHLQSRGATGERALLLYQPGLDYIVAFFACLYAGVLAVPAYPPRKNGNLSRLQAVVTDSQAAFALTTEAIHISIERRFADSHELAALNWVATDELPEDAAASWRLPIDLTGDTLAFLQYTSGSTSAPKGVMLSHGNLLHNLKLIEQAFGTTPESKGVIWLPPYHDMGLIGGILQPLYTGYPMIGMAPVDFITRPLRWLEAISKTGATVSGGPNFAYDLCLQKITPEQRDTLDLSTWENAFSGAEPIRHETLERFAEFFAPAGFRKEAFYPCYGLAEGTLFVSGGLQKEAPISQKFQAKALEDNVVQLGLDEQGNGHTLVSSGRPALMEQKIAIAHPELMTSSTAAEVGEIWVSGGSVAQGYWKNPEKTEETFQARLADTGEGPFLRTGDLGFIKDGELYVTGRLKDLIIIRGRNYYPQDIEFCVRESHPAVGNNNGAAFSIDVDGEERLVIVYELERSFRKGDHALVAQAIREAVSEQHQLQIHALVLIKPASIPKTSSGKIQRHACRERFLNGTLDVIFSTSDQQGAAADTSEAVGAVGGEEQAAEALTLETLRARPEAERLDALTAHLQRQTAEVLKMKAAQIDPELSVNGFGLDSLMVVELKNGIEDSFGVEVPFARFLEGPSLRELASDVLAEASGAAQVPVPAVVAVREATDLFPLSHGQRALWFLQKLDPNSAAYNIGRAVRVTGELDVDALQTALGRLTERHPSLRTVFEQQGGEPVQRVREQIALPLAVHNASLLTESELTAALQEEAGKAFDLEKGPLLRMNVYQRAAKESVLQLVVHHVIVDFWSLSVLVDELWALYDGLRQGAEVELAPLNADYGDYVLGQEEWLGSAKGERLWKYWQEQLKGAQTILNLPTDRPRPAVQTYNGSALPFRMSPELSERVKAFAKERGVTLYVLLMAAYQTLLHRYTGQEDLLVGSPTASRSSAKFADVIGYFINPVAVRGKFAEGQTFGEFLENMRGAVLGALDHQEYPFSLLVERLQPHRDPSYSPLYQVMFTWQKSHLEAEGLTGLAVGTEGARLRTAGLELESISLPSAAAQMDLWLTMGKVDGQLVGAMEYNTDLFDQATIRRMTVHLETLLGALVQEPERVIAEMPLLSAEEREQLLAGWNATETEYPSDRCVHHLFEEQAERTPDAVAVVFEDGSLTYAELNRRANQLAHRLQGMGVGPDVLVALCMERSLEMMVGLLGVMKAGGAYVPLDPTYPADRLAFILEDAQAAVLLTQPHLVNQLPSQSAQVLALDAGFAAISEESGDNTESGVGPDQVAYMIYTSGSTGKPKGVMIEHRNAVNFFAGMDQRIGATDEDTLLAVTSICFDISVLELFYTLVRGSKVILLSEAEASGGLSRTQAKRAANGMDFSLFYFASDEGEESDDKYQLLIEGAKYADSHGFTAVWTPERHFHQFGGLYPSPAVISGALAMVTKQVKLRTGSVVLPLHNPIRVAEDWSVVDNLSKGRVELSFASGWHADDFVFAPEQYANRTDVMFESIRTVQQLWTGESVNVRGGAGNEVAVRTLPRPVQKELPVWITSGGNAETFRRAGEIGAHLLTHLLGQSVEELAEKIAVYRQALADNGFDPARGRVALMLHTYIGDNMDAVREKVRKPFTDYLRSSFGLVVNLVRSANLDVDLDNLSDADREGIMSFAFDRYFETSGLFGTPETCLAMTDRLKGIGVDEIACLIDFGVENDAVLQSLDQLNRLRSTCAGEGEQETVQTDDYSIAAQAKLHQATMLQCTPSLMKIMSADSRNLAALGSLRTLMLGGEALSAKQAEQLRRDLPNTRLVNLYGPTEATVWATTFEVEQAGEYVPIGRPFANVQTYVLDAHLQPVPVGLPGELHIGGDGVARGYHLRPELTAERFISNPFRDDETARLYKTGDLVTYLPDGNIKFLGRLDHQVKIRGFRIELGEIEEVLGQHPDVREAVVVDRDEAGDKYLAAYAVTEAGQVPSAEELRAHLLTKVPDYMVPSAFVFLDRLPLTPNGKIDRKALPDPVNQRAKSEVAYVAPQNEMEQRVSTIWQEVLHVDKVGIHDNFFEIGGHSLQAVQVHSKLKEQLNLDIPIVQLFQYPTVSALAKYLSQGDQGQTVVDQSRERAASRREMMQQRRNARGRK